MFMLGRGLVRTHVILSCIGKVHYTLLLVLILLLLLNYNIFISFVFNSFVSLRLEIVSILVLATLNSEPFGKALLLLSDSKLVFTVIVAGISINIISIDAISMNSILIIMCTAIDLHAKTLVISCFSS